MIQWQPRKPGLWRRIETAIAATLGLIFLGLVLQGARVVLHVITGEAL